MTDEEVYEKYTDKWIDCDASHYRDFIKNIPTKYFIQYLNHIRRCTDIDILYSELQELKSCDIPEDQKLEVLLLLGEVYG